MATLHEYFIKDASKTLCLNHNSQILSSKGKILVEIAARLHLDFEANALYVSFYIPETDKVECPSRMVLNSLNEVLGMLNNVYIEGGMIDEKSPSTNLKFTGRVYIYSEDFVKQEDKDYIQTRSAELGYSVIFRTQNYSIERSKFEKPLAFISYDSRDKKLIAEPLAIEMHKLMCPVWYDDFALKVGDSLRDSIEKGLRECQKCVFLITPNFLENSGWTKREYDSIFTRELVEKQNVILPVWYNVDHKDIYQYSPILADRFAVRWEEGVENVAQKLIRTINI